MHIERLAQYERVVSGGCGRRRGARLSDLERIQDLFPHDYLALHDLDALATQLATNNTQKTKSLRKRPSLDLNGSNGTIRGASTSAPRTFIMEAPVALRALSPEGAPTLDRHLFLFSDVLLVGKARGSNCFKLKESVRLSEAWLAVTDGDDTGFLVGWPSGSPGGSPVATYLATYPTQAARDSWFRKLQSALNTQLAAEPKSTNIQVIYKDPFTTVEFCKTLSVSPELTTSSVIRQALQVFTSEGSGWGPPHEFTLCARSTRDAPATPLNGIERPHAIQMSRIRQTLSNEDGFDLEHVNAKNNPCGMVFELKKKSSLVKSATSPGTMGGRGLRLLRRGVSSRLLGVSLSRLNNGSPPPLILQMLRRLRAHAPNTHGVFRRSANVKALRMLREKLDALGGSCPGCPDLDRENVLLLAAMVKDFFRSLPQPLLGDQLYHQWIAIINLSTNEKMSAVQSLLLKLPKPNYTMLTYFVCLLQAIANKHAVNFMCPTNLGVCVGPSLLWPPAPCDKAPKAVPIIIEFLIVKADALFGRQIGTLLGNGSTESSTALLDSGAEESDSLHSVGISLDSMELTSPRKEKLSLSRDSGLTLSEDDSNSNGGNSPAPRNGPGHPPAPTRRTDSHNVNGLPQISRRYKTDIYNTLPSDDYYATPYSNETYVHNTINVGIDRNMSTERNHEDMYGQTPVKYMTGLEPQKPPRTNISKTARTTKVCSMYADNSQADADDVTNKPFHRAKSSDNLLDFKQAQYENKLASSQENILYGSHQLPHNENHHVNYQNMDFLGNSNYSRVYTDWEKRSAAYSRTSNRSAHSDNIYGRNKQEEKKHFAPKTGANTQAATIFTRNDWSRQARPATRTKSLEVSEDIYGGKCEEKARAHWHAHSPCHRRQADPAHMCTSSCTVRASDKMHPLQNSYSYAEPHASPADARKNRHRSQNNQKIAHSKSLANIILQSDSSSSDTLYQPRGSPFQPHSDTASEQSLRAHYAEPLYSAAYSRRHDIFTATPTAVHEESPAPQPPPVPPRKMVYQKVVKKPPASQEEQPAPPYRSPPDTIALDCSDSDTESESYV